MWRLLQQNLTWRFLYLYICFSMNCAAFLKKGSENRRRGSLYLHNDSTPVNDHNLLSGRNITLHKKWSFPLRISSVNVTKFAVSCRFGHIYWRNPSWKTLFFVQYYPKLELYNFRSFDKNMILAINSVSLAFFKPKSFNRCKISLGYSSSKNGNFHGKFHHISSHLDV